MLSAYCNPNADIKTKNSLFLAYCFGESTTRNNREMMTDDSVLFSAKRKAIPIIASNEILNK